MAERVLADGSLATASPFALDGSLAAWERWLAHRISERAWKWAFGRPHHSL